MEGNTLFATVLTVLLSGLAAMAAPAPVQPPAPAGPPTNGVPAEMAAAAKWAAGLEGKFSFIYGSRPSAAFLPGWKKTSRKADAPASGALFIGTFTDPTTGLEVRAEATLFSDFPAVEWVLHFKNTGASDTLILEAALPLDGSLLLAAGAAAPVLRYANGALCSINDFAPREKTFEPGASLHLQPGGGRSSSEYLPFFNVDLGSEGMIIGVGWTGEWAADFARPTPGRLRLASGLARMRLKLHPGEEIRTPRMLALFWKGEAIRGNNLLRRFILAHHRPAPGGKPLVLPVVLGSWGGDKASDHLKRIERIVKRDLPIEVYWVDAEWFGGSVWWKSNGNWAVRKDLYPDGFRALSAPLHEAGRKFLLWFEPQRVCRGTDWAKFLDKPGWLLELKGGAPEYKQHDMDWKVPQYDPRWVMWESRRSQIAENDMSWNMGDPAARRFLTDWLSDRFDEFGLDWYREDFNIAPGEYWQEADAPDRVGMTEIRYIEGLYAMWDELLRRHPGLAIDNCSSGGRRIDLETLGRATALWRTDYPANARTLQCHTFGLMSWVPLHMTDGVVMAAGSEYDWRSAMTAGLNVKLPEKDDDETARQAKAQIDQYRGIRKYFYGDYYPLTKYSQAKDAWVAYQLDLPESGEGLVVVLKREECKDGTVTLKLKGLSEGATYEVTDLDTARSRTLTGKDLAGAGLTVELTEQPDSALIRYRVAGK